MKISLINKSNFVEHVTISFKMGISEKQLIKALGLLDDNKIEFIELPNYLVSKEMIKNYFVPDIYRVEF